LDQLRTHYFDIVSVEAEEVIVRLRPKSAPRPIGFHPRPKR
jgi:hypothetical protein